MGATESKEITFETLSTNKQFSVRRYPATVYAEAVPQGKNIPDVDESIQLLNEYIGFKGNAKNFEKKTLPMIRPYMVRVNDTAPKHDDEDEVKVDDKDQGNTKATEELKEGQAPPTKDVGSQDLKASILTTNIGTVMYFLPSEITDPAAAPQALDKRIELNQFETCFVAARPFNGHFSKKLYARESAKLFQDLVSSGYLPAEVNNGSSAYIVAHFTLGKQFGNEQVFGSHVHNEIWVRLPDSTPLQVDQAAFDAAAAAADTKKGGASVAATGGEGGAGESSGGESSGASAQA